MELAASGPTPGTATAQFEANSPQVVVWDGKTQPWGKELLRFPNLARITDQAAASVWKIYTAYDAALVVDDQEESPATVDIIGYEGVIRVSGQGPFSMSQRVGNVPATLDERWIEAEAWVRCDEPGGVSLAVSHSADEGAVQIWHGGGGWQRLSIAGPYLWGGGAGHIDFRVMRRNQNATIHIAHPSLKIVDENPKTRARATGNASELLVNGNFERYEGSEVPYPWLSASWNGEPGEVRSVTMAGPDKTQSRVVEMTFGAATMSLAQRSATLGEEYAGYRAVGRVFGQASTRYGLDFRLSAILPSGDPIEGLEMLVDHPGGSVWQPMEATIVLPTDTSKYPLQLSFQVLRRNRDKESVFIDNASLELIQGE